VVDTIGNATSSTSSLRAQRALQASSQRRARTLAQLATGQQINSASDDPAGLIASQSLGQTLAALDAETSINQLASAQANTTGAALGQISTLLTQAKSLVDANAGTGALSDQEISANQLQIDSIISTIDNLAATTSFGGQNLLDGTGAVSASGQSFTIASAASGSIGTTTSGGTTFTLADLQSGQQASTLGPNAAVSGAIVDQAIQDISTQQATLGAFQKNTIEPSLTSIATSRAQLLSAVSMLQDTDFTLAAMQQSQDQILQAASFASLMQGVGHRRISTFSIFG